MAPRNSYRAASTSSSVTGMSAEPSPAETLLAAMALSRATAANLGDCPPRCRNEFALALHLPGEIAGHVCRSQVEGKSPPAALS